MRATLVLAAAALGGCLDAVYDQDRACSPDLPSIERTIFAPSCSQHGCHEPVEPERTGAEEGAGPAAGLSLVGEGLEARLLYETANDCADRRLVVPGSPRASVLFRKLDGTPVCDDPMPPTGALLSAEELACIETWIAGLACETCGGGTCVDLTRSAEHCGACGNACPDGVACADSACTCASGLGACPGGCVDLGSDPRHCGACGDACPAGSSCEDGQCACDGGLAACDGACVDTNTSLLHCGACDRPCADGARCVGGRCECAAPAVDCGGVCVNTQTSHDRCGSCAGPACGTTEFCVGGDCSGQCGLDLCPADCVSTGTTCQCIDTDADVANCGACGNRCATGSTCSGGQCSCPAGEAPCGGVCVDVTSDPNHCGTACAVCPAGQVCQDARCVCPGGGSVCNGACTDSEVDPDNCGSCNVRCAPGQACVLGQCTCSATAVTFSGEVLPLLSGCSSGSCHGTVAPKANLSLTAANAYGDLVNVAADKCSNGRLRVAPGAPERSFLLDKLLGSDVAGCTAGKQMPSGAGAVPFTSAKIEVISAWICNGAPND